MCKSVNVSSCMLCMKQGALHNLVIKAKDAINECGLNSARSELHDNFASIMHSGL